MAIGKDYAGFDNPKEMFEDATGKLSVRTTGTDKKLMFGSPQM